MKFLFALVVFLTFATPVFAAELPAEGQAAPAFSLQSHEGKLVSLADFKGKWVVLYFYPKDATPGCSREAQEFQEDIEKYKALNAEVVGVSMDDTASHVAFRTKEKLTFTLLSDTGGEVSGAYGSLKGAGFLALSARNSFLIDPQGVLRMTYLDVDPGTHSTNVLEDLRGFQAQ